MQIPKVLIPFSFLKETDIGENVTNLKLSECVQGENGNFWTEYI